MKLKKLTLSSLAAGTTVCALLAPSAVLAADVAPTNYSMPNGDGQAHGGTFNYWDANYTGSGNTTTDGAALSGGLGKITDGAISTSFWSDASNNAGTGEYVGWFHGNTANPVITFNFASSPLIDSISIQMDNSQVGGVFAPTAILIDGIGRSFAAPAIGSVGPVSFSGLGLIGDSHTIEFQQAADSWTFVSEISFAAPVPEPETYAMLLAGLGLLGAAVARRRKHDVS